MLRKLWRLISMKDQQIRQRLVDLLGSEESDSDLVKPLLELAIALHSWNLNCISKIECGASLQDSSYAGEIQLLISDHRGTWPVSVRASWFGKMITFIDENKTMDSKKEAELEHIFEKHGFQYVPHRLLLETCPKEGYDNWFDCYFSWM